jgi:hypothetical protein
MDDSHEVVDVSVPIFSDNERETVERGKVDVEVLDAFDAVEVVEAYDDEPINVV